MDHLPAEALEEPLLSTSNNHRTTEQGLSENSRKRHSNNDSSETSATSTATRLTDNGRDDDDDDGPMIVHLGDDSNRFIVPFDSDVDGFLDGFLDGGICSSRSRDAAETQVAILVIAQWIWASLMFHSGDVDDFSWFTAFVMFLLGNGMLVSLLLYKKRLVGQKLKVREVFPSILFLGLFLAALIEAGFNLDDVFWGLSELFAAAILLIVAGMVRATIISSLQDSHIARNDSCFNNLPGARAMSRTFQRTEEGHFENLRDMEESEEEDLRAQQERMDSYLENLTRTNTHSCNNARFRKKNYVVGSLVLFVLFTLLFFDEDAQQWTDNWDDDLDDDFT